MEQSIINTINKRLRQRTEQQEYTNEEIDALCTPVRLQNKPVPLDDRFTVLYHFSVERDNFGNNKYFTIITKDPKNQLVEVLNDSSDYEGLAIENIKFKAGEDYYVPDGYSYLAITKDNLEKLRQKLLNANPKIPVIQLNIKCDLKIIQTDGELSITGHGDIERWESFMTSNAGYYQTQIALTFSQITDLLEHQHTFSDAYKSHISEEYNLEQIEDPDEKEQLLSKYCLTTYLNKIENPTETDLAYPKLRTDFWKHGAAGIIDIQETIKPCMWYGKQHPFEFEFIAGNSSAYYKRFDSIQLLTNNVAPDSIHYTVIGDEYSFAKDKRNMYFRQEATKAFYQQNGSDILYDHNAFTNDFRAQITPIKTSNFIETDNSGNSLRHKSAQSSLYKSTILPLVYSRQDTFNEIEDYYKKATSNFQSYDYPNLTGGEILYNKRENTFCIQNHVKVRDIEAVGRSRGNAEFKNDHWNLQITPLRIYQKNESWSDVPPINLSNAPVPEDMYPVQLQTDGSELLIQDKHISDDEPDNWTKDLSEYVPDEVRKVGYTTTSNLDITTWDSIYSQSTETRLIGSYIKVKVRYNGKQLVLVKAVNTQFEPKV